MRFSDSMMDSGFIVDRRSPGLYLDPRKLCLQGCASCLQRCVVDIQQRQVRVAGGERSRHGQANTIARAGNEYHFAGDVLNRLALRKAGEHFCSDSCFSHTASQSFSSCGLPASSSGVPRKTILPCPSKHTAVDIFMAIVSFCSTRITDTPCLWIS